MAPPAQTPSQPAADRLDPALIRLAAVLVLGAVAVGLDSTIVTVALDRLAQQFHATVSAVQWVSSAYLLALAFVIPATGWAVDRFGAKPLWLASLAGFGIGSALCGTAWSLGSLIAFRALQGVGGGMILPLATTILAQAAGPGRLGRVMSIASAPAQIAPIVGPLVGGAILDAASWRWCFYLNVPVCLLALAGSRRIMPEPPPRNAPHLDGLGLALLSPGLAALVYGLSVAVAAGFATPRASVPIAAGGVLLGGFVLHALRTHNSPLIDIRLFRRRSFGAASLLLFLLTFSLYGTMVLAPLYFQQVRGASALQAGELLAPQFAGTALSLLAVGKLTDRRGPRPLLVGGVLITLAGTVPLVLVGHDPALWVLATGLLVRGVGVGAASVAVMTAAYGDIPTQDIPRATSATQIAQRIGAALGAALLALILQSQSSLGDPHLLGHAYGVTFAWALLLTVPALLPAFLVGPRSRAKTS